MADTCTSVERLIACTRLEMATVSMAAHLLEHFPGENTARFQGFSNAKRLSVRRISSNYAYLPTVSNVNVCNFHWWSHTHLLYTILKAVHFIKPYSSMTIITNNVAVCSYESSDKSGRLISHKYD